MLTVSDIEQISGKGHCLEVRQNSMPTEVRKDELEKGSSLPHIQEDTTDLAGVECCGYEDTG